MILSRILQFFSSEKKILRFIKSSNTPSEIYQTYQKNKENFTPLLLLESLKQLGSNTVKRRYDDGQEDPVFYEDVAETFKQLPVQDKWRFYVQIAKIGKNKQLIKQFGGELVCLKVKQIAILLWGYHKNGIKKPRVVIHLIEQLQLNLEKLVIIPERGIQKREPKQQAIQEEETDEYDDEDFLEEQLESSLQPNVFLKDLHFKFKDLVLIVWAIEDIKLDANLLIVYTFKTAIDNFKNKDLVSNKTLILLLQATLKHKDNKQIGAYQKEVVQYLSEQDLSNEGILQLLILVRILAKLRQNPEFAVRIAQLMLKNQEKQNQHFSSKFTSIIVWNLNKLGIVNTELYNKFGLHLIKCNEFKAMDISQAILIYSVQQTKSPEYQQYQFILRSLISKANIIKLDQRSQNIIKESITQYQPHLLKLLKK